MTPPPAETTFAVLTDEQTTRVLAAAAATGPKTPAQMQKILTWAEEAATLGGLLEMVLAGRLVVGLDAGGEIYFTGPDARPAHTGE